VPGVLQIRSRLASASCSCFDEPVAIGSSPTEVREIPCFREFLHLRWSEGGCVARAVAPSGFKTGRKTTILNAPALLILADLQGLGPFVFPGEKTGKPRADLKRPWAAISNAAGLDGLRLPNLPSHACELRCWCRPRAVHHWQAARPHAVGDTAKRVRNNPGLNRGIENLPNDSVEVVNLVQRRMRETAEAAGRPGQANSNNLIAATLRTRAAPIAVAEAVTGGSMASLPAQEPPRAARPGVSGPAD
jgi:hypothetical protein